MIDSKSHTSQASGMVDALVWTVPGHPLSEPDTGIGRIILLILGVGVIYGLYKYFF